MQPENGQSIISHGNSVTMQNACFMAVLSEGGAPLKERAL